MDQFKQRYAVTIEQVTKYLQSFSIDVQLRFDFEKNSDSYGYYNPETNEIVIFIFKSEKAMAFLELNLTDQAILVLCHELGHKFDPNFITSLNRKKQFELDLDHYIKNNNITKYWAEYLDLVIRMELAAWENGKPYVPSYLKEKYNIHNELNIFTYLSKWLVTLTKYYDSTKLFGHLSPLTKEWLDKCETSPALHQYLNK